MHDVQVKVLQTPILQLLSDHRLDTLPVVEGVPELGNDEELFTLDETILDGSSDTLTGLDLISVI